MTSFFQFLKSKQFFIHLIIILLIIFGTIFGLIKWISNYTDHSKFVFVPDFKGQKISNLKAVCDTANVEFKIIDSIYDPNQEFGIVIRQDPEAKSKVKHNRTIYLYVTGTSAPKTKMPKLIDRSERQAKLMIETYGFKVGSVTFKKADCIGCVISQSIKGKEIKVDDLINKGSTIDIVVGSTKNSGEEENDSLNTSTKEIKTE